LFGVAAELFAVLEPGRFSGQFKGVDVVAEATQVLRVGEAKEGSGIIIEGTRNSIELVMKLCKEALDANRTVKASNGTSEIWISLVQPLTCNCNTDQPDRCIRAENGKPCMCQCHPR
jgi:hypothetical protein